MRADDPQAVDILRKAMVARIATLSRNRRPNINPLYFVYDNGRIYLGTSDRTLAALNAKAHPQVTILFNVDREPNDRRILRVRGDVTVRTDDRLCRWYIRRTVAKYFLNWSGLWNTLSHARLLSVMRRYLSSGEKGKQCVLECRPGQAELVTR